MEKNKDAIRSDSFSDYMEAPCGRLLTKLVLKDLGKENEYPALKKKYTYTFISRLRGEKGPTTQILFVNEKIIPQTILKNH